MNPLPVPLFFLAAAQAAAPTPAPSNDVVCGTGQITSLAYSLPDQGNNLNLGFTMSSQPANASDYFAANNRSYLVLRYSDPNRFPVASQTLRQAFVEKLPVKVIAKNTKSGCKQDDQSFEILVCLTTSDSTCR